MVYQQGSSTHSFGALVAGNGIAGIAGDMVSQTNLSLRAAPPKKKSEFVWFLLGVLLVIGGCVGLVLFFFGSPPDKPDPGSVHDPIMMGLAVVCFLLSVLPFVAAFSNAKFNRTDWRALHLRWMQSWMCMRCGMIWKPTSSRE
jgi:drug/metabolite transporter (DMT)-like permease